MNIHIEELKAPYDDPLTLAAAELIASDVYLGDDPPDYHIRFLSANTVKGYTLVGDGSQLIGAATINRLVRAQTDLVDIAVREQYRNRGYGEVLVRYIAAQALGRGDDSIVAYTPPESRQRRFFERLGFVLDLGEDKNERRLQASPLTILRSYLKVTE